MGAINDIVISFTCPGCNTRSEYSLMHIDKQYTKRGKPPTATRRCWCKRCEGLIILTYYIWKSREGLFKLRVHKCLFNGERCIGKRYRVLQPSTREG